MEQRPEWCGVDVAPWDAKHRSRREGKSSHWWWLIFSGPPVRLLGPDQALPARSANYTRQGRAHHGDQPLSKTQIVFIFCSVLLTVEEGPGWGGFPYEF